MYSADDLIAKLREIETLIRERVNPDGTLVFDPEKVMVGLELAKRMIISEKAIDS